MNPSLALTLLIAVNLCGFIAVVWAVNYLGREIGLWD